MKKLIMLILIVVLIIPQIVAAQAEDERRFIVTYQNTNIREKSTTSSPKLASVPQGREYEIIGEVKDSDGKIWFQIAFQPDKSAYVASWVVNTKTTKPPEKIEGKKVIIDPSVKVNIRSLANTNSEIVQVIKERTIFPILAENKTPDLWYQIDLGNDKTGWVKADKTKGIISDNLKKEALVDMVAHVKPLVNIREQPSTNSRKLTRTTSSIQPNVISKVIGEEDGKLWYEIELPTGQIGWVRSDMASLTGRETATSISNQIAVIPAKLNIRTGAGTTFKELFRTKSIQRLTVISKLPDVNGDTWYQVETEHGVGWVYGPLIEITSTSEFNTVHVGAKLRLAPSEGAKLIHSQRSEVRCGISGSSVDSNNGVWYLVTTSEGETGWVYGKNITVRSGVDKPPVIVVGEKVTIQRRTTLAPFPSSKDGEPLYPSATGTIKATAIRDGGTLYYQITSGKNIGWVLAETTRKHYESQATYAVNVGKLTWKPRGDILEFNIPISMKPVIKYKNYSDDPHINLFLENALYEDTKYGIDIGTRLVSGVIVTQNTKPATLLFTFKLNKAAGFHMYPVNAGSESIKLEIFEKPPEDEISVFIQGQPVYSNNPPFILDEAVMVPLQSIADKIGAPLRIIDKSKGIIELQSERIALTFTANKTKIDFVQMLDEHKGEDNQFVPSPRYSGDDDEVFFVPLEPLAKHLDFSYHFYPENNQVFLDPIIDRIDIGGCGNESETCRIIETNISTIADYNSVELPNGQEKITIFNTSLGRKATNDLDKSRINVEFISRTADSPSQVILKVTKRENERISIGELRNPNRLIIQINERIHAGLAGKVILIDPGHGNLVMGGIFDEGCISLSGIKESLLALRIAKAIQIKLEKKDAKVVLTRNKENSENSTLDDRINIANSGGSHMFISIHTGFSKDTSLQGCQTFYHAPLGKRLAEFIQPSLVRATGFPNLGLWKKNYYICKKISGIPSVLIEPVFISNSSGEKWAEDQKNIDKLAEEITEGITRYYEEIP